jgi:hypothetical protein
VVASALRYRAHAPLVDSLMKDVGLSGADLNGLTAGLTAGLKAPHASGPSRGTDA